MRYLIFIIGMIIPTVTYGQVVISEVMWVGSEISTADEWLELSNISDETVSLSGWTITKRSSDGGDTEMILFSEDAQILAGDFFLIANYDAEKSALSVSPDLVSTSVSLANSKLYLQLIDEEGEVVDAVDDGTGSPFAGGKTPYASMERIDLKSSGEEADNWKSAEVSVGFDEGVEVMGTPGKERGDTSPQMSSNSSMHSEASSSQCGQVCPLSKIRITEVLLNPKDSEDYEWIELGNLGTEPVDITGWILSDGSRSYVVEPRSQSGYILEPAEHTLFFHHQTGIALSSAGEVITLFNSQGEVDRIDVSKTGEEISFGREPDGSRGPFCVPTPRAENSEDLLDPKIVIQSGRSTDYTKVTLNLKAEVEEGSLKDAECFWDFKDGTSSKKCNPPSHSWDYYGVYNVELRVMTKCGNEIKRGTDVVVLQKNKNLKSSKSSASIPARIVQKSQESMSISSYAISTSSLQVSKFSSSSSLIEQKMYSTKTSSRSSQNPVEALRVRYKNIPQYSSSAITSKTAASTYSFKNFVPQEVARHQESGIPWVLLFSQSALWLVLAGKRMI
jgi:hypothetical protein